MAKSGGICGSGHGFYRGPRCPKCQERPDALTVNLNQSSDPAHMDAETVAFHMEHKSEVEKGLASGKVKEYRPGSNRHFRADVPKRFY